MAGLKCGLDVLSPIDNVDNLLLRLGETFQKKKQVIATLRLHLH